MMNRSGRLRLAAAGFAAALLGPAAAQQSPPDPGVAQEAARADEESAEARKARAKEERIAEYLRKQEEKRLTRAEARSARELERIQAREATGAATGAAPAGAAAAPLPTRRRAALPRDLARAQARVRQTGMAADPGVAALLDKIDRQLASPHELAAFANFISEHGLHREALEYYRVAVRLIADDPVLWVNLGTLQRKLHDPAAAMSAYSRALAINPNYALAHYNIGAILDDRGKYHGALEAYKVALRLDPTLSDPAVNPQAATNDNLATVKLLLYEEEIGGSGLPLIEVAAEAVPAADRK